MQLLVVWCNLKSKNKRWRWKRWRFSKRLAILQEELAEQREKANNLKMKWEIEKKKSIKSVINVKKSIVAKRELEQAEADYNLEKLLNFVMDVFQLLNKSWRN